MATQQKITVTIPNGYTRKQREEIGQRIVAFIRERSISGADKNNKALPSYTKEYARRKGSSSVNLSLSGDMLGNLQVLNIGTNTITIGYPKGYSGNGKVEGNITGSYGGKFARPDKARDFLGVSGRDVNAILFDFPLPSKSVSKIQREMKKEIQGLNKKQLEALGIGSGLGTSNTQDKSTFDAFALGLGQGLGKVDDKAEEKGEKEVFKLLTDFDDLF